MKETNNKRMNLANGWIFRTIIRYACLQKHPILKIFGGLSYDKRETKN